MKYELKRVSVWSVVKITFFLSLITGFLFGLFYALLIMMIAALPISMRDGEGSGFLAAFAGIAAFMLPFIFAIFSAVFNSILATIGTFAYNQIAKMTGGIEWELREIPAVVQVTSVAGFSQPPAGGEPNSSV